MRANEGGGGVQQGHPVRGARGGEEGGVWASCASCRPAALGRPKMNSDTFDLLKNVN
jgi:hypothetical protein